MPEPHYANGKKSSSPCQAILESEIPSSIRRIHLVLDNSSVHHGKKVQAWLAHQPRLVCFFLPVHWECQNQVEQWLSILQRKRLGFSDFSDLTQLSERLMAFVAEYSTSLKKDATGIPLVALLALLETASKGSEFRPFFMTCCTEWKSHAHPDPLVNQICC